MCSTSALKLCERQSGARSQQRGTQDNQVSDLSGAIGMLLMTSSTSESYEEDRKLMQGPHNSPGFTVRAMCAITLLGAGVWLPCGDQ